MPEKLIVIPAILRKNNHKINCKLDLVDSEVFYCAYYLLRGRLHILGITKNHASLVITPRVKVINLTEKDWKLIGKAKPLVMEIINKFSKTRGLNLFEDTESKINLI